MNVSLKMLLSSSDCACWAALSRRALGHPVVSFSASLTVKVLSSLKEAPKIPLQSPLSRSATRPLPPPKERLVWPAAVCSAADDTLVLPCVHLCFLFPARRKAVKATLVLLPLLGITYMLFFVNPGEDDISQIVFIYFNSFLQSFQVREQVVQLVPAAAGRFLSALPP